MDIQELRREAQTMRPQLTADRRRLHRNPEAGAVLPETVAYVKERLTEMGYHPQELGGGLTATVTGTDTGRRILLRADMDAPPGTGAVGPVLPVGKRLYARLRPRYAHCHAGCGPLLMQHRQELSGTVKLVFQPDEEGFTGAKGHAGGRSPARSGPQRGAGPPRPLRHLPERCCAAAGPSWRAVPCSASQCGERAPRGHAGDGRGPHRHRRPDLAGPAGDHRPGASPPRPRQW